MKRGYMIIIWSAVFFAFLDAFQAIWRFAYLFESFGDQVTLVTVSILIHVSSLFVFYFVAYLTLKMIWFREGESGNDRAETFGAGVVLWIYLSAALIFLCHHGYRRLIPVMPQAGLVALILIASISMSAILVFLIGKMIRMISSRKLVAVCFVILLVFIGVRKATALSFPVSEVPQKPNVLLFSIDALRPDHLGLYGYEKNTSPFMDELAKKSAVFENVITQSSWTLPTHMSMMTSLYPSVHGVYSSTTKVKLLDKQRVTLAELLREHGYRTGAFTIGGNIGKTYFDDGFDFFDDEIAYPTRMSHLIYLNMVGRGLGLYQTRDVKGTVDSLLYVIRRSRKKPFFFFTHLYDVHIPYEPPRAYLDIFLKHKNEKLVPYVEQPGLMTSEVVDALTDRDRAFFKAYYDAEIRYVDDQLKRVYEKLAELGIENETLIVITADHGEEFWDHGKFGHATALFEETVRVPLVIYDPSLSEKGRMIAGQVESIDIYPTVADVAEVATPEEIQGQSLLPIITGTSSGDQYAFSEMEKRGKDGVVKMQMIRTGRYKLILDELQNKEMVFDLENDPKERRNLAYDKPEVTMELRKRLESWEKENKKLRDQLESERKEKVETIEIDKLTQEKLKSLGYLN